MHSKEFNALPQAAESLSLYPYVITIINKSDTPIFIDLGNSYRVDRIEDSTDSKVWYDGIVFSENHNSSSSIGIGVGAITNALGIGGTVGSIANGISIGGPFGNGVSINKGIQRFVSIAPHSSMKMPAHPYVDGKKVCEHFEWLNISIGDNGKNDSI